MMSDSDLDGFSDGYEVKNGTDPTDKSDFPLTNSVQDKKVIPIKFELMQNYPNPFNPVTYIIYKIPTDSKVRLIIYDVLGRQVNILENINKTVGSYIAKWDGCDDMGQPVSAGIYIYRLQANNFISSKKMILIR
jgi:hypothetical protein